jgi:hypothetical protein
LNKRRLASWLVVVGLLAGAGTATAASQKSSLAGLPPRAYVVATSDGSTLRLYVNGTRVGAVKAHGAPAANRFPLEIGSYAGQAVWHGTVDDVALYDSVLAPHTIEQRYNAGLGQMKGYAKRVESTPGLVAYYRLDEPGGRKAKDSAGRDGGTYVPGTSQGVPGLITGDKDTGISLNGKHGSVRIDKPPALGRRFSLEAWVTVAETGNRAILAKVNSYYVKTDVLGRWAAGFWSGGKGYTVSSLKGPVAPKAGAKTEKPAKKKTSGGGGSGGSGLMWIPILAVIGAVGAFLVRRRGRAKA